MGRSRKKLLTAAPDIGFACEVGLALGLTLAGVARLSEAELSIWRAYRDRYGFPADRAVWATAIGASYTGAVWGGRVKADDLIPKFHRAAPREATAAEIADVAAWFESVGR